MQLEEKLTTLLETSFLAILGEVYELHLTDLLVLSEERTEDFLSLPLLPDVHVHVIPLQALFVIAHLKL